MVRLELPKARQFRVAPLAATNKLNGETAVVASRISPAPRQFRVAPLAATNKLNGATAFVASRIPPPPVALRSTSGYR